MSPLYWGTYGKWHCIKTLPDVGKMVSAPWGEAMLASKPVDDPPMFRILSRGEAGVSPYRSMRPEQVRDFHQPGWPSLHPELEKSQEMLVPRMWVWAEKEGTGLVWSYLGQLQGGWKSHVKERLSGVGGMGSPDVRSGQGSGILTGPPGSKNPVPCIPRLG